jgi:hypothetical protein
MLFFFWQIKTVYSQDHPFQEGEEFTFVVYYDAPLFGKLNAGKANLELKKTEDKRLGKTVFHAVGTGFSSGTFDFFFKVRDRFESWFDIENLRSYFFTRRTNEGGYIADDDVCFDYKKGKAISRKKEKRIEMSVQDLVSAFYFARTLDIATIPVGGSFPINFYLDDSIYTSVIIYEGKEIVETRLGKFRTMKFKPMVVQGEVFDNPYPMFLWVTDDKNRIPILVKSEIIVGSINGELYKFKNLKYPLDSKVLKTKTKK